MTFFWAILFGLVLGFLSGFFSHRRDPGSIVLRMLVGIVGGVLGAVIAVSFAPANAWLWISALGAVVLLLIYWLIVGDRKAP